MKQFKDMLEQSIEEELNREDMGGENAGRDVPGKSKVKDKDKKNKGKVSKKDPADEGIPRQD